jgi:hypothetical protein
MMMMFPRSRLIAAVLTGLVLVAACANLEDPARKALSDADAALAKIGPDAQKYVPEQYTAVSEQVADMKAAFDKKNYQAVLDAAPKVATSMKALADSATAKKNEATEALDAAWTSMAAAFPKSVAAVQAKLADLKKAKKLPKGVTKDAIASADAQMAAVQQSWTDATAAQGKGDLDGAVAKAKDADAKLTDVMNSLGMGSGDAAAR